MENSRIHPGKKAGLVGLLALCMTVTSVFAGVSDIKRNLQNGTERLSDTYSHSNGNPGYQIGSVPSSNWTPQIDLTGSTGSPRIDISRATGAISSTTGVSNSIKNYVNSKTAEIKPPSQVYIWVNVESNTTRNGSYGTIHEGRRCDTKGQTVWANKSHIKSGWYNIYKYICL